MFDFPKPPPSHFVQTLLAARPSIIKVQPPSSRSETFEELVCTPEDESDIYELLTTMAQNGKGYLLLNQGHLRYLGAKIAHIHPVKFLGFIFKKQNQERNPNRPIDLKWCVVQILDDYFKRTEFIDGLSQSLSRESDKQRIDPFLDGFIAQVGSPPEETRKLFRERKWHDLVLFLTAQ